MFLFLDLVRDYVNVNTLTLVASVRQLPLYVRRQFGRDRISMDYGFESNKLIGLY